MRRFLFLTTLLFPSFAMAMAQAGFPTQPIWVSSASPTESEMVVVSAVVVNDTEATLRGTLVFLANDARIGAREFELPSGKSQIHSIEWKPKKGEYKIVARIEGTPSELSQKETPAITITVKEPPAPPSEIQKAITQAVQTGSALASSSVPIILRTAQNLFAQTENLRNAGIERLENYLAANAVRTKSTSAGAIAGTSNEDASDFDEDTKDGKSVISNIAQTAAAGALFAFKNIALFYPILALLILGTLYSLARRVRRLRE